MNAAQGERWNQTFNTAAGAVRVIAEPTETRLVIQHNGHELHQVLAFHLRPAEAKEYAEALAYAATEGDSMVSIQATPEGNLAFVTPYNPAAIEALKATVPSTDRQWDGAAKRWIVTPDHGAALVQIARQYYGQIVTVPAAAVNTARTRTGIFNMRYLGRVKDRGTEQSAYGWVDGGWKLVFPAAVLKGWFGVENRPGEALTLYNVLAVTPDAAGAEIKSAWRRLIRQWHPDRNNEPDAAAQFMAIQTAYETLSDPAKRARYDAGLRLERSLRAGAVLKLNTAAANVTAAQEYSAPLRCGYVMADGTDKLGRFVVSKIIEWQDITRDDGCILVSSWPEGADMFQERWVRA